MELMGFCLLALLCYSCVKSDITKGIVPNKKLAVYFVVAIIYDVVYYGFFASDLAVAFIVNVIIVSAVSLILFYTHSFAGGDCKMAIVLVSLFPAGCYIDIWGTNYTIVAAMGISLVFGYVYLLANSIALIARRKGTMTLDYVKSSLFTFAKSYLAAISYIAFIGSFILLIDDFDFTISIWITRATCVIVALCVGRYQSLKKWFFFVPAAFAAMLISAVVGESPISLRPEYIVLVFVLFLCQMTIRTTIYERVNVSDLKKGMILTTISSVLMQSSITKGLPGISTEDLRSRLTDEEIESVKIWAKATRTTSLTIVKKVPFAALLAAGFLAYAVLGGVLSWE